MSHKFAEILLASHNDEEVGRRVIVPIADIAAVRERDDGNADIYRKSNQLPFTTANPFEEVRKMLDEGDWA